MNFPFQVFRFFLPGFRFLVPTQEITELFVFPRFVKQSVDFREIELFAPKEAPVGASVA